MTRKNAIIRIRELEFKNRRLACNAAFMKEFVYVTNPFVKVCAFAIFAYGFVYLRDGETQDDAMLKLRGLTLFAAGMLTAPCPEFFWSKYERFRKAYTENAESIAVWLDEHKTEIAAVEAASNAEEKKL